jgi:hypothetical protein
MGNDLVWKLLIYMNSWGIGMIIIAFYIQGTFSKY